MSIHSSPSSAKFSRTKLLVAPPSSRQAKLFVAQALLPVLFLLVAASSSRPRSDGSHPDDTTGKEGNSLFLDCPTGRNHAPNSSPAADHWPRLLSRGHELPLHSPAKCLTNFPNGRHNASTFPKSSAVKSAPASIGELPLRLTCITPTTFPSHKIGALMIF
jgi:hypothetical protein